MTFADLYARTMFRRQWHVCGEVLLPLTVGHARFLDAMELWHPGTWIDLMACAWICGRPPVDFRLPRGGLEKLRWRIRLWRLGHHSFISHALQWRDYVDHHLAVPVVSWDGGGKSRKPGTPPYTMLRASLIRIGYSPERVDEAPIDQALLDCYATQELDGRVRVSAFSSDDLNQRFKEARSHVQSLGKN